MGTILDNLVVVRTAANLSIDDAARAAGVSAIWWTNAENGGELSSSDVDKVIVALNSDRASLGARDI